MKNTLVVLVWLFAIVTQAATFTVTPNVVSNNFTGRVVFQMTGLASGDSVLVQEFFDANNNGVVDAGDFAVRSDWVTDGRMSLLAGATNLDVVHDEDGATNGAITASFRFPTTPDLARTLGQYIFRFSSPSNHFTPSNAVFTVASPTYAQSIQGVVTSSGTNVPNAFIALLDPAAVEGTPAIIRNVADATGHYSIPAPSGTYQVTATRPGYVGDPSVFPIVTLSPNVTITTNLSLIPANCTISGYLADSTNAALKILPGAQLLAFSTNSLFTIAVADTNGNFSIPVTTNNIWTIRPYAQSAISQAYLPLDPGFESQYNTSSGSLGAYIFLEHATAMLYGTVQDNHGNPIAGVGLAANVITPYDSYGFSDTNGAYTMVTDQGGGFINVENTGIAPANSYLFGGTGFSINSGQATSLNIIGYLATARFRSHVIDDSGAPVTNMFAFANNSETGVTTFGNTGTSGFLDMPVFAGTWTLEVGEYFLVFPDMTPFTIVDGVNLTNDIVAHRVTGSISGYVLGTNGIGIPNLRITITNSIGTTNFTLSRQTAADGSYFVPVFNGTWNVSVDPDYLNSAGYYPVNPVDVPVPPALAEADFTATNLPPIPPPQILTTNLPDGSISNSYFTQITVINGSGAFVWSVTSGALPGGLNLDNFGDIYGDPTNIGLFTFAVQVTDWRGSNDMQVLSINVLATPPGPLQISAITIPTLAVGCPYTNQLQATGGSPPYSWTLAPDSNPLPDGLTLDTNGLLSGIPTASSYFYPVVQVSDSLGAVTNEQVSISVNTELQTYSAPMPAGWVGWSYYGYPPVSGGAQSQTWTIVSNSLPPGLTNDPVNGVISGVPTTNGVFNFTLEINDGCTIADLDLTITNYPAPLQITTTSLPYPTVGCPYTNQLQALGGTPPYSWALSPDSAPLPDGLNFDTNGVISGIPATAGFFYPTFQIGDSDESVTNEELYISVNSALMVTSSPLPPGEVGLNYYGYPPINGGSQTQTWTVVSNSLPPGLTNDPASGVISGIPTTDGIYNFTLEVNDGCSIADIPLSVTNYPALQISAASLPIARPNVPYTAQLLETGGIPPVYWYTSDSLGELILNSDGSITGTPLESGSYNFLAQVYDDYGGYATNNFVLVVSSQPMLDLPRHSGQHQFTFRITGVSGQSYTVQFANKLTNWADLLTTNAPADVFFLTDTNATNQSRFYQLKVNP